jgi:hypothetical protein
MPETLNKQQLISLVQTLMHGNGEELQVAEWQTLIDRSVPCPVGYFFDLIFYPHRHGLAESPTAEAVVEKALQYKPIQL